MSRTSKLNLLAGLLALALISAMVLRMSSAAFTGSTSNSGNSWDAGTVSLSDNDSGSAMFTAPNMKPGDSVNGCVQVTYTGSIVPSAPVSLAAAVTEQIGSNGGNGLGDDLDVTVSLGALGTTCALWTAVGASTAYSGTLAAMSGASTGWTPTASGGADTVRAFRFVITLGSDTPNTAQTDGADAVFTWSATS